MKINGRGSSIIFDAGNSDDQSACYELVCVCGHKLSEHASPIFWYYPDPQHHIIFTRQCTHFSKEDSNKFCCDQFQVKE